VQVKEAFTVRAEEYKKKKPVAPKYKVEFFDNPPTLGEIHHNQVFKFIEHFEKFSQASNRVSFRIMANSCSSEAAVWHQPS
jgi:hypothetical protein